MALNLTSMPYFVQVSVPGLPNDKIPPRKMLFSESSYHKNLKNGIIQGLHTGQGEYPSAIARGLGNGVLVGPRFAQSDR